MAFSGRQALHGTQPDASAACMVMLSKSSALRNLIRMQSAVWYRAIPGTTETSPPVVAGTEPFPGLFAGVPPDSGVAVFAASFAVGAGVAATGDGAAGLAAADAGLCLTALPAAGLAASASDSRAPAGMPGAGVP